MKKSAEDTLAHFAVNWFLSEPVTACGGGHRHTRLSMPNTDVYPSDGVILVGNTEVPVETVVGSMEFCM